MADDMIGTQIQKQNSHSQYLGIMQSVFCLAGAAQGLRGNIGADPRPVGKRSRWTEPPPRWWCYGYWIFTQANTHRRWGACKKSAGWSGTGSWCYGASRSPIHRVL